MADAGHGQLTLPRGPTPFCDENTISLTQGITGSTTLAAVSTTGADGWDNDNSSDTTLPPTHCLDTTSPVVSNSSNTTAVNITDGDSRAREAAINVDNSSNTGTTTSDDDSASTAATNGSSNTGTTTTTTGDDDSASKAATNASSNTGTTTTTTGDDDSASTAATSDSSNTSTTTTTTSDDDSASTAATNDSSNTGTTTTTTGDDDSASTAATNDSSNTGTTTTTTGDDDSASKAATSDSSNTGTTTTTTGDDDSASKAAPTTDGSNTGTTTTTTGDDGSASTTATNDSSNTGTTTTTTSDDDSASTAATNDNSNTGTTTTITGDDDSASTAATNDSSNTGTTTTTTGDDDSASKAATNDSNNTGTTTTTIGDDDSASKAAPTTDGSNTGTTTTTTTGDDDSASKAAPTTDGSNTGTTTTTTGDDDSASKAAPTTDGSNTGTTTTTTGDDDSASKAAPTTDAIDGRDAGTTGEDNSTTRLDHNKSQVVSMADNGSQTECPVVLNPDPMVVERMTAELSSLRAAVSELRQSHKIEVDALRTELHDLRGRLVPTESDKNTAQTSKRKQKAAPAVTPGYIYRNPAACWDWYDDFAAMMDKACQNKADIFLLDGRSETYMKPPFPSNHASNLELMPNHDVLLAWNRVVVSLKQSWLLPIYYAKSGKEQTSAVKECLHQQLFEDDWTEHPIQDSSYLVQPSIIRPKPGEPKLIAFFRDRNAKHIYRSESADDGVTWTKPTKTTLPNNNSGIQASVLQSGNIVLVYNPTNHARNPLVISMSEDGGQTWPHTRPLQSSDNPEDEFSYPSVAQDAEGQIHVSHTYLRHTIKYHIIPNEDWIKERDTKAN
nr:hypothetical protein BaRGS_003053 [Batillaria attramentaria]